MDLDNLSLLIEVIGLLAVLSAIVFGVLQVKQFRQQRQDLAAIELVRSFQTTDFTNAFRILISLPKGISGPAFAAKDSTYIDAAWSLGFAYETTAVLVHRGVIPITAVEDLIGGIGITLWNRMSPWVHMVRKEQSQEHIFEWFQWLVERMEERGTNEQKAAHLLFKDWKSKV